MGESSLNLLVISSSLSSNSRSRIMARYAYDLLKKDIHDIKYIDLVDFELPICDGDLSYDHPHVKTLNKYIKTADGILVATPIYNFDVNAALKNLVELTGRYWVDKVVGFMSSAGGSKSYMSMMSLANSLMLDFRCIIIPRFVFAEGNSENEQILNKSIKKKIVELSKEMLRFVDGLKS